MLSVYRNMFRIRDLRNKILFTLFIFAAYRLGTAIPVPGVDPAAIKEYADSAEQSGIVGLLNLFSGGALSTFSVFSLGIMPYITSSIIMQLLAVVIPRLQRLQEEGESGRKLITQWTRYLTVILSLLQSTGITFLLSRSNTVLTGATPLITNYTPGRVLIMVLTMTAGTAFIMWLGELITQRGVGNGMSLIIFVSIVSSIPAQFAGIQANASALQFWVIMLMFLALTAGIIFVDQGQRRVPIQFSKRVRGRRVLGGQSTYIPMKVNNAGVIPIIFASSVLYFPALISSSIPAEGFFGAIRRFVDNNLVSGGSWWYVIFFGMLIIFFTYFYTAIQFDPARQSDMIQRQGGFIPGIRPGSATTKYLEHILSRITLPGSLFLASVAVLPSVVAIIWNINLGFSGISILIVVGVALETMKQIESQLMMRNYEGFLT
ncbi:MAG: preprotein translocase subunit SecY [Actinobacteria bacterium]|nr:preprotein translocase subunit SecY [Actinomycetota bacterium]MBU1492566.1 preprotein translocase subunit SecY [Actinomycetota bacterium]